MAGLLVVFLAMGVLVAIATRINVAYPIVLLLGGMAIGFIPGVPVVQLPPDVVLLIFLPPLLYWESVTAPVREFKAGAFWIFQMAFGLVIVTTVVVAAVAHAVVPAMTWGAAFVLGAVVSSTDEVAFTALAERLRLPRHLVGTIEGESLVNDATSLILYGAAITAVVAGTFSLAHDALAFVLVVVESIVIGLLAGGLAALAWRTIKDATMQGVVSVTVPFVAYIPAYALGASGVLATVVAGVVAARYAPLYLLPRAREALGGFWGTVVFLLNAFIFVEVGIAFRTILDRLHAYAWWQLVLWGAIVAAACIVVRLVWTFAQGFLPITNEPEHAAGKADWSHVALLSWTGMRGGVSLAAALAIPVETASGPFPFRDLIIFLTFAVLLATLVGQGGTLPLAIEWLKIKDDGAAASEERVALAATARAGLAKLDEIQREGKVPDVILELHRRRLSTRAAEFEGAGSDSAARLTATYREVQDAVVQAQRARLIELGREGQIDITVLQRIQRVLDLATIEDEILTSAGHLGLEDAED